MKRLIIVALLLAGCATLTPEQRAQQLIDTYTPMCEKLGHGPGSPQYANCIVYLAEQDAAREHERRQAMGAVGMQLLNMSQPYTLPAPVPRNTYTNCQAVGNMVHCRSW